MEIYAANRDVLPGPDILPLDVVIQIPAVTAVEPTDEGLIAVGAGANPQKPGATGLRTYRVRLGDTLKSISRQFYGTQSRHGELLEANRDVIIGADDLPEGIVLTIP